MPFRWGHGWTTGKLTLPVTRDAKGQITERIEVIGAGCQWVMDGTHGGTRRPYDWPNGRPRSVRTDDLPVIGPAGMRDLMEALRSLVGLPGTEGQVTGRMRGWTASVDAPEAPSGAEKHWRQMQLRGPEDKMRDLVLAIANDGAVPYQDYATMLHAIKGAAGNESWGLDCWMEWSSRYPGNNPETNLDKWAALAPDAVRIGADWLIDKAPITQGNKVRQRMELIQWRRHMEEDQGTWLPGAPT